MTKLTGKFKSYATSLDPPPTPWRGRKSRQNGASAWRRNFFSPTTPALWAKTLFSINLKQFTTVHYSIQVRTYTTGTVRYLTDTKSINQLLMSCQCTRSIYASGGKKEIFSPHTQLGTESKGKEVSGFLESIISLKGKEKFKKRVLSFF